MPQVASGVHTERQSGPLDFERVQIHCRDQQIIGAAADKARGLVVVAIGARQMVERGEPTEHFHELRRESRIVLAEAAGFVLDQMGENVAPPALQLVALFDRLGKQSRQCLDGLLCIGNFPVSVNDAIARALYLAVYRSATPWA